MTHVGCVFPKWFDVLKSSIRVGISGVGVFGKRYAGTNTNFKNEAPSVPNDKVEKMG
jgi:hypothetical protein